MWLGEWPYSSRLLKWSVYLFMLVFFLITLAFSTPYWLVSVADEDLPQPKFTKLGLWVVCLNGFRDMKLQYEQVFYGCKHILLEDYDIIRDEIQPPFFVATQLFFTLCFCGLLATILLLLMYLFCINDYYRVPVLRAVAVVLLASAAMGALALIIFGVHGDGRDFMPDWEHNYHSWSFGIAAVGVILQMGDGILFAVEARTILRREKAEMKQHPMERNV